AGQAKAHLFRIVNYGAKGRSHVDRTAKDVLYQLNALRAKRLIVCMPPKGRQAREPGCERHHVSVDSDEVSLAVGCEKRPSIVNIRKHHRVTQREPRPSPSAPQGVSE